MATEHEGFPHVRARTLRLPAVPDEDIAITGNNAVARLRHSTPPLSEACVLSVRAHLEHVLRSPNFDGSQRSREFLRYVVEEVLAGRAAYLKQAAIAVEVFGRKPDFDAVIDPIVRVQAGRLRRSLERYYLLSSDTGAMRIELPKGSYAPVFVEAAAPPSQVTAIETVNNWPTVVVFPFAAQSARHEAVAAQLCEELTAELCRYGIVHVVRPRDVNEADPSPLLSARFELQGVVRDVLGESQFTARLVDRASGQQVWADEFHSAPRPERWSGSATDIGRVIAARIGAEHGVITRLLAGEYSAGRFPQLDPFGAIARCQHFMLARHAGALAPAIEALQDLTHRAPEIELGWTSLAQLYLMNHSYELSSMFTPVELAIGCANQSVLLEPASARTRCVMASALLVKGELASARRELDLALRHNSESLAYREIVGWLMALAGDWDQGVALMRTAMDRNPYYHPCVSHGLWADALRRGDFASAYSNALGYRVASFFWRELMIACSLGHLGRTEEAAASAAELLRCKPQFAYRGRRLIAHYIKSDQLRDIVIEGLRKAGIDVS